MVMENGVNGRLLDVVRPLVDRVMLLRERECAIQLVAVASEFAFIAFNLLHHNLRGEATDIGPCGIALCTFPANTCCFSYVKSFNCMEYFFQNDEKLIIADRANSFFCGMDSVRLYVDDCSGARVPYNQPVIQNPVTEATVRKHFSLSLFTIHILIITNVQNP